MGTEKHALLSASASHRWLHCTPSAKLEATLPDSTSIDAKKGTLAHSLAELKLRKYCIEPMGARTFNSRLKKLQGNELWEDEMMGHTDTYLDYIASILHSFDSPPYVAAEKKIDYSAYAPEGFGTCDCIIIGNGSMNVIDFKYGKGVPVSAIENSQMMLYALGAYTEYSFLYGIETVKMTIVQPRLDSISEFEIPIDELLTWGEDIKPLAEMAFKGEGEYVAGDHCRFCRAYRKACRQNAESYLSLESFNNMLPPLLSIEEVGQILERAKGLAAWAKKLEEYALEESLKGSEVPGWKAVEGRSIRQFTDIDTAFEVLKANGFEETMLYERKPLTLAETEKLIGKSKFSELLGSFINSPPGKPTLVPMSDKREAIKQTSAAEVFSCTTTD